ncbi:putative Chitin deacetylase [Candidatus Microthrix parvicella RN1]|jgi:peptidoglycan/xylan/chitin deacetylase (PgdA/CDA1 family)|uniref:Putative Chitin deacetylase n=1 Tax=Candidatus Neomicrothrix parvicella RN1 TaxID=1229780 RepID=R4YXR2_9ACTN|nr:putative Chitin deacetylase [Candidatus Microthrix parvicella RN1]
MMNRSPNHSDGQSLSQGSASFPVAKVGVALVAVAALVFGGWRGIERQAERSDSTGQAGAATLQTPRSSSAATWPQSFVVTPVSTALKQKAAADQAAAAAAATTIPALPQRGAWDELAPVPGSEVHDVSSLPALSKELAPVVVLTFDDGPGPQTAAILDILQREQVTASFFMLGSQVRERPEDARAVAAAGFPIGSHTMDHKDLATLTPYEVEREIRDSTSAINEVVGKGTVQCMRAPYGSFNDETLGVAKEQSLGLVGWDVDTEDWKVRDSARILARATMPGHRQLILMHDAGGNRDATVAALPQIIARYKAQGARFISLCGSELDGGNATTEAPVVASPVTTAPKPPTLG